MPTTTPYIPRNPGDLITAEDWNDMQVTMRDDTQAQLHKAIADLKRVDRAGDSDTLGGKSVDELTKAIVEAALQALPGRTGYRKLFKRLRVGEERVIEHGLKACPLVDAYQLDYFEVVCAEGDHEREARWVNFYVYNRSEAHLRLPAQGTTPARTIEIESVDAQAFKCKFKDVLAEHHVEYSDESSLDDVVGDFWTALFAKPNDPFEPEQFCHSPWFEKCCGEKRTVGMLRRQGEWDDNIWFQARPRKTVNFPAGGFEIQPAVVATRTTDQAALPLPTPAPTQLQVVHFDLDRIGVKLLRPPVYPAVLTDKVKPDELKLMLLLKV